ncbi:MAG: hypothetical protein Q7U10_07120 [Thermodesulfovibrionia bacterium]|nr:hypothetical protein [Thermodesulfovibrionia bacterium]
MKIGFADWTDEELHFYTFQKKGSSLTLENTSSIPVQGEPEQSALAALKASGMSYIYLSLPAAFLSLRELEFPFADEKKISDTIAYELEGLLLGDTSGYCIDHIVTSSSDTGSKVLAVCMEKAKLDAIIKTFTAAGLEPKVVTSLDLRLSGNNYDRILEAQTQDKEIRADAAREELIHPSINIRRGDLSFTGDIKKFINISNLTALLVLLLLIIFGVNLTLKYKLISREHNMLISQVEGAFRSTFPEDTKVVDITRQFTSNVNILKNKKKMLSGIAPLDMLGRITDITNDLATLDEIRADGDNIIIKGIVPAFKDVEALKNSLSASFDNVSVTDSTSTTGDKISFTIVMKEKAS